MGRFDLNDAADFARLTGSGPASVLLDLTGRDPSQWDILEGSYNGVLFHIFQSKEAYQGALSQVSEQGGRRKVEYAFPYQDGQTTDDLGRRAESITLDIVIHGNRYLQGFTRLMKELQKPTPGVLVHPIRGDITCGMKDYQITHTSAQRKAVAIQLTMIEHNFTIGEFGRLGSLKDSTFKGAIAKALAIFAEFDRAIANTQGAVFFAQSLKNKIVAALEDVKTGAAGLLAQMNQAFNSGSSADLPTLLPVNEGGTGTGGSAGATFTTVTSPNDPFASVPQSVVSSSTSQAIAATQITKDVNTLRASIAAVIADISSGGGGQGALLMYDEILELKRSAVLLQDALEKGIASSQARIVEYVTPRVMSLREVAFANGLDVDKVLELDLLNPSLLSTNHIEAGTTLQVPVS